MKISKLLANTGIFGGLLLTTLGTTSGCKSKSAPAAPPDQHVREGQRLLYSNPAAALSAFLQAENPKNPSAVLGQGQAYEELHDYAHAEQTLAKGGDVPEIKLALVRVQILLGKLKEARENIDALLSKPSGDLNPILIETCLANDAARAKRAREHLDAWHTERSKPGTSTVFGAEYFLAQAAVLVVLAEPEAGRAAKSDAAKAVFRDEANAAVLASLAAKGDQVPYAHFLLEQLASKYRTPAVLRQVALTAYQIGAFDISGQALSWIKQENGPDLVRLRALQEAATNGPKSVELLRQALAVSTDKAQETELRLLLGNALLRDHQNADARAELDKIASVEPSNQGAQLQLARLDLIENKAAAAVARLEPLAQPDTAAGPVRELLASAYVGAKQPAKAFEQLDLVLKQTPNNAHALETLIALDLHDGKKDVAIDRLKKQIELVPNDPELRLLQTKVLRQVGLEKEAETALAASVAALPKATRLCVALSRFEQARKANDEAQKTLHDCERVNPESLQVLAEIAVLYTRMNDGKAALPYYEKVLRFAADDPLLLNNAAMIFADELNDGAKAVPLAEHAHTLAPNSQDVTDTYAWSLYKRGGKPDLVLARTLLEGLPLSKTNPTVKYHLGMVLLAIEPALGKKALTEALALSADFPEASAARQALAGK